MKWIDARNHKPKNGSYIWIWDIIKQKQELYVASWVDGDWNVDHFDPRFAKIWAYVLDDDIDK